MKCIKSFKRMLFCRSPDREDDQKPIEPIQDETPSGKKTKEKNCKNSQRICTPVTNIQFRLSSVQVTVTSPTDSLGGKKETSLNDTGETFGKGALITQGPGFLY